MSKSEKFWIFLVVIALVVGACSVTIQVQKDNCNSSFENSTTSSNSADSASVDLNIK
nr:MAG TPA: hypothetical protein [Microviridae sp.]